MSITAKGFIFSADLAATTILIFIMLFTVVSSVSSRNLNAVQELKAVQLQKNAVFLLDSIVKNNSENGLVGAALFDVEKRRVKSNELDHGKIWSVKEIEAEEFFVQKLSIVKRNGKEETVLEKGRKGNCFGFSRMALLGNETVKVELVLCEK